jgi:cyanate lyase
MALWIQPGGLSGPCPGGLSGRRWWAFRGPEIMRPQSSPPRSTTIDRLKHALVVVLFVAAATPAVADQSTPRTTAMVPIFASAAPSSIVHRGAKAPADEYFGRLKMSILGVRNTINVVDYRADNATDDGARDLCHKLMLTEDALRDWQAKYPADPWIPRFGYALVKVYEKIDADLHEETANDASVHAIDLGGWLDRTYPGSEFAPK